MTPDNQTSAALTGEIQEALECVDNPQDAEGNRVEYVSIEQARVLAAALRAASRQQGEAVAWVDVPEGEQMAPEYPGYKFHGIKQLDAGKHSLYTAPPALPAPALPVAQKQEGGEVEPYRYFDEGMRSYQRAIDRGEIPEPSTPAAAPALSEGLTEAVETALAWFEGDDPAYDGDAEVNYGKILAAEVRRQHIAPKNYLIAHEFDQKTITAMRTELKARHAKEDGEFWYWQGDGTDNLETLTCPILIRPEELRRLSPTPTQPEAQA